MMGKSWLVTYYKYKVWCNLNYFVSERNASPGKGKKKMLSSGYTICEDFFSLHVDMDRKFHAFLTEAKGIQLV